MWVDNTYHRCLERVYCQKSSVGSWSNRLQKITMLCLCYSWFHIGTAHVSGGPLQKSSRRHSQGSRADRRVLLETMPVIKFTHRGLMLVAISFFVRVIHTGQNKVQYPSWKTLFGLFRVMDQTGSHQFNNIVF